MARYRSILTKIWKDEKFQNFSKDDKYLFLYLLSNEQTSESGVYHITPKTIFQETDLPIEVAIKGLKSGLQGAIEYDGKENLVWVVNFLKYQQNRSPNMIISIRNDIKLCMNKSFIKQHFIKHYNIILDDINLNLKTDKPIPTPLLKPRPIPIGGLKSPLTAPSNEGGEVKEEIDMSWAKPQ